MNIDLSYYEVEMGYLKDGADDIDYESPFSICISTKYHPDNECIIELCKDKLGKDYDYVHCLSRISAEEQREQYPDRTYRVMSADERREVKYHIKSLLNHAVVSDYLERIINCVDTETNQSFVDAVIDDVKTSSAWHDDGYFSNDDVRLAIGRELMARLGVEI